MNRAIPVIILLVLTLGLTIGWDLFVEDIHKRSESFYKPQNFGDILRHNADKGFLAIGMTLVILSGGIDLSVGSTLGLSCVLTAIAVNTGNPWLPFAVAIGIGALVGFANGAGVAFGQVPSFIATLATMGIARGICLLANRGTPVEIRSSSSPFSELDQNIANVLPVSGIFFLISIAIVHFLLQRTTFGRHIYAIGGNEEAARLCGIRTRTLKLWVFTLAGILAGIAGLFYTARLSSGPPRAGEMYELDAIAMVVIGGTSLTGGKGSVLGTLYGFFLIGILTKVLSMRSISSDVQYIVVGTALVGTAILQTWRKR